MSETRTAVRPVRDREAKLSREDQAARRELIIDALRRGLPVKSIAAQFGVSPSLVRKARQRAATAPA